MTNIEQILSRLNPKTAEAFRIASQVENHLLPTPSLGLNIAIKGLGYGRQTTLWGNRSGGKTMFCLMAAAQAQKEGKSVAWIDAEKNFDKSWARRLGVDTDEMIISKITSIADMADAGYDLMKEGIDVLVVDSVSALLPQSFFEDKGEMKPLANTGQIGTFSKNLGTALNMFNRVNEHTALILISQVRTNITQTGGVPIPMGGIALQHMNSTQIKLWANPNIKEAIKGEVTNGDLVFERPVGRKTIWTVEKNRGPGMNMTGEYDLYFAGDFVGIDVVGEILDYGVEVGAVRKGGAWLYIGEEKFQGRPAAVKYLRQNTDIKEKIYQEILEKAV